VGQKNEETPPADIYRLPPPEIVRLVDAPRTPAAMIDPRRELILLMEQPSLPPISEIARPELRLAGLRIDPSTNGTSQEYYLTGLSILRIADGSIRSITGLSDEARIRHASWSPDGSHIAFTVTSADGISLWIADVATAEAVPLTPPFLNEAIHSPAYSWLPSNDALICRSIPANRGPAPTAPAVPTGPMIHESSGRTAPTRTYQDLLRTPHDEALFDHYATAQLQRVALDGSRRSIGEPGLFTTVAPSPNGRWLLVVQIERPYSYLVPQFRFPHRSEVWSADGEQVRTMAEIPLAEEVPISFDAVRAGRRGFNWRVDAPEILYWVEARDGGDPDVPADVRDTLYTLEAPFDSEPRVLLDLEMRYAGAYWGSSALAFVSEYWWKSRRLRTWRIAPDSAERAPRMLYDRTWEDRYGDPGSPVLRRADSGGVLLHASDDGNVVHLIGDGASPEGNRPFLDRLDLRTKQSIRRIQSEAPI
jgi:dipeptidyl aminopeptidase/acylaminoacyl peptidase